jgi:hypothetical protein
MMAMVNDMKGSGRAGRSNYSLREPDVNLPENAFFDLPLNEPGGESYRWNVPPGTGAGNGAADCCVGWAGCDGWAAAAGCPSVG